MISKLEAKRAIQELWRSHGAEPGTRRAKRAFYARIKDEHPELLTFQNGGDKWLQVELWLYGR